MEHTNIEFHKKAIRLWFNEHPEVSMNALEKANGGSVLYQGCLSKFKRGERDLTDDQIILLISILKRYGY